MNIVKLQSPDFTVGKILVAGRAYLEIAALLLARPSRESLHLARLISRIKPHYTMVRNFNLINLYRMVRYINRNNIPGAIVECGVWNGGSAAMMAAASRDSGVQREMWLFDSFEGLPRPSERDSAIERAFYFEDWNKGSIEKVKHVFNTLNLSLDQVNFVKGWFDQTIPGAPVREIALLHIDADWYDSVRMVLQSLYDRVAPGGYIVLDDYGYWQGCNQAVHDFFTERGIPRSALRRVSDMGAYFQKPWA